MLLERGPDRVSPFFILSTIVNLAAGQVSLRLGAKGPSSAVATACTTGAHAVGDAFRLIQHGYADAMVCGGTEASITPLGVAGFAAMRALSTRNDAPERASRPWDVDRDGFVVGEGAGILVLEERGARRTPRRADPRRARRLRHELRRASPDRAARRWRGRRPRDDRGARGRRPDARRTCSTSTRTRPRRRSATARRPSRSPACSASTPRSLAVSSTKSMTGHLLGGAGALEAGLTVLALRDQIAPPTTNLDQPGRGQPAESGAEPRDAARDRQRDDQLVRLRRHQREPDLRAAVIGA